MSLREGGLIDRSKVANLLLGLGAPSSEAAIIEIFSEAEFFPPIDFVLTPFDYLVLSQFVQHGGINFRVSTEDLVSIIEAEFAKLDYKVEVTPTDITNYFIVLRGFRTGDSLADGLKTATSANFPDIRNRYNCLHSIVSIARAKWNDHLQLELPDYKREVQYLIASRIAEGQTVKAISEELLGFNRVNSVIDMMILDILEQEQILYCGEYHQPHTLLLSELQRACDQYDQEYSGDSARIFRDELNAGNFLATANYPLSTFVSPTIASIWLQILAENPQTFKAWDSDYVKRYTRAYIKSGAGAPNELTAQDLGTKHITLGGFIVDLSFGLASPAINFADVIDAHYASDELLTGENELDLVVAES